MILHVAALDKFIPPFVKLVEKEFQGEKHRFWFTGAVERYPVERSETVFVCEDGLLGRIAGYGKLVKQIHSARKVMLHGLFNIKVVLVLALCPWVLPKCHWVIWGGDLYQFTKNQNTWRSRMKELLRRFVISRIGHLVTYIKGDVELARQWYGAKGKYHECIMYLSNVVDPKLAVQSQPEPGHNGLNIVLGNSADPSNNHIEALERLLPFKEENIRIYAPLSYGDQKHAKKVIGQGKEWFGDKFIPMTDFITFDKYLRFLTSLDVAIFNHQRQQAMGTTITLLGMGKTVFMRTDVSQWSFLNELGIKLNDACDLRLRQIAPDEAGENARIIRLYFSREVLVNQLSVIFEG